ncbi:uncharacterized protein LOC116176294 [Photinus pyralis]|uniref:uncharacterized protein LOC116173243 n=1 Tax=Photinus pyralis TaxID=7054 RepID=UPI0012671F54|nr:uncharacterized protein LOC116173243 [Photinus pyralis]XP_031350651.1 uncharacterized protein LOC116176294 [Photinus pyralis]
MKLRSGKIKEEPKMDVTKEVSAITENMEDNSACTSFHGMEETLRTSTPKGDDIGKLVSVIQLMSQQIEQKIEQQAQETEQKITEKIDHQSEKLKQIQLSFKEANKQLRKEVEQQIGDQREECNYRANTVLNICDGRWKQLVETQEKVKELSSGVTEIETKIQNTIREIQHVGIRSNTSSGEVFKMSDSIKLIPEFDGQSKVMQPLEFLKFLENAWKNVNITEENKLNITMRKLSGSAKMWADISNTDWNCFENFKQDFMEQYWSQKIQDEVRMKIMGHREYQSRNGNYVDHARYWIKQAMHLNPPMEERQIVNSLSKHYPKEVERALVSAGVKNKKEMLEKLDELYKVDQRRSNPRNQERVNAVEYHTDRGGHRGAYRGRGGGGFRQGEENRNPRFNERRYSPQRAQYNNEREHLN